MSTRLWLAVTQLTERLPGSQMIGAALAVVAGTATRAEATSAVPAAAEAIRIFKIPHFVLRRRHGEHHRPLRPNLLLPRINNHSHCNPNPTVRCDRSKHDAQQHGSASYLRNV
ncbi:hypothetical protein ACWD7C_00755 [Streptomyces sp. NPDC005134]|uniref:hypothetical protein n=1 Tax=unclassified Streptomyces TaxID=2593676 RepID=UPI0033A8E259